MTELKEDVRKAWASTTLSYVSKFNGSMSKRLVQVAEQDGRETTYRINSYVHVMMPVFRRISYPRRVRRKCFYSIIKIIYCSRKLTQ